MNSPTGMNHGYRPNPHDVGICAKCGELYEYDENYNLIQPTLETMLKINDADSRAIDHAQAMIRQLRPLG